MTRSSPTLKYLKFVDRICRRNGQRSVESFLLEHGRPFPGVNPRPALFGPPRECYRSAAILALNDPTLFYTEGFAVPKAVGIPLSHAWTVNAQGQVIDPTWPDGCHFWGVTITTQSLSRLLQKHKHYGLLYGFKGFGPGPLLTLTPRQLKAAILPATQPRQQPVTSP